MSIPRLLQIIREEGKYHNQNPFLLGEITSITPLKVKTNNIEIDDDQLQTISMDTLQVNDVVLLTYLGSKFIILGKVRDVT